MNCGGGYKRRSENGRSPADDREIVTPDVIEEGESCCPPFFLLENRAAQITGGPAGEDSQSLGCGRNHDFVLVESAKPADSIRAAEVCAGVKPGEIIFF